ncbi:hypothetical protein B9G54_05180 [Alloscardovia macacae]|uniref:HTH-type transcriptional regulator AraC-type N-terminal domain-containing protein n=1 Tax=Alloscardovia macacae TaxID=1160091 RepID=A0A1Y2SXS2_9BIFI|nr:AraC family transcriptional regulator ligand-binding domain-containing protein [Alloscardovia macacae]OTA26374.1 hypothetical protein B9G54_05180 [Alloscardovia macacae]OTA28820.1 hypothetical protein B9T39_05700 [Alloscardovia macacae]
MVLNESFRVDGQYVRVLAQHGVDVAQALVCVGLARDTFAQKEVVMPARAYLEFMTEVGRQLSSRASDGRGCSSMRAAIVLATSEGIETFSAPLFAAYCSKDGMVCLERLALYKPLVGPLEMDVCQTEDGFVRVTYASAAGQDLPAFFTVCEYAFLVGLLRAATGEQIRPVELSIPSVFSSANSSQVDTSDLEELYDYFGVYPTAGD